MYKSNLLPHMVERVKTCRWCGQEMDVSALSYAENPFCKGCLVDRLHDGQGDGAYLGWRSEGNYFVLTDLAGQKPH